MAGMSSWPPTIVDWGVLTPRLRDGDRVCQVHGRVDAGLGPVGVPVCPHCGQMVTIARRDRQAVLRGFIEPVPPRCPRGHLLDGGRVILGWQSCGCSYASPGPGGHRTWQCPACITAGTQDGAEDHGGMSDTMRWPPHSAELQ